MLVKLFALGGLGVLISYYGREIKAWLNKEITIDRLFLILLLILAFILGMGLEAYWVSKVFGIPLG